VRVTSAPIPIAAGALVRISGWIRTLADESHAPIIRIEDSFGGKGLAQYHRGAAEWRPFVLYRAAPNPSPLRLTFDLFAPGEVWLDDVRVEVLR
jgi:hypothetical protein